MKLRLETRHRLLVIATGADAAEDDEGVEAVVGGGNSADLTMTDRETTATEPDAKRRRGVGFTEHRTPTA